MSNRDSLPLQMQTRSSDIANILDGYKGDEYCSMLLALFCVKHPKTLGFNEIRRELSLMTNNVNTSPNALNRHLKHLIENKVIQKKSDDESNLKIKPIHYSLTPAFTELAKDLFIVNQGLDVELLKEELKAMSVDEASRKVAFILLNDVIDEVRDSLVLDPKIAEFKQVLKSARTKVALDAYSSVINDSGNREEALIILSEINEKLSSYVDFGKDTG